jgi:hypothetical protein
MSTKQDHKRWRKLFNEECLLRDNYHCVLCDERQDLDVHHITDRHDMPNGGYVRSNGITVCHKHHVMCEQFHMGNKVEEGFLPEDLYIKISSSYKQAIEDSNNLT